MKALIDFISLFIFVQAITANNTVEFVEKLKNQQLVVGMGSISHPQPHLFTPYGFKNYQVQPMEDGFYRIMDNKDTVGIMYYEDGWPVYVFDKEKLE